MAAWLAPYLFSNRRLAELGGMRAARLYSIGMAVSFGGLTLLSDASPGTARVFIEQALVSASWVVAGLSMLSATRDLEKRDTEDGVSTLQASRGYDPMTRVRIRNMSVAMRILVAVAAPAISVVLFASPHNGLLWALRSLGFVLAYASALAATLAGLSYLCARWAPRSARVAVLGCVLGPELLRASVFPNLVSVPRAFAWAIERSETIRSALG